MQLFVLPIFFLAGAVFPIARLPGWLATLTRFDPLSYAVDPMRRTVFSAVHAPRSVTRTLSPGMSWFGWRIPTLVELAVAVGVAALLMTGAVYQFSRQE